MARVSAAGLTNSKDTESNAMTKPLKMTFLSAILLAMFLPASAQTSATSQTGDALAQATQAEPQEAASPSADSERDLTLGHWRGRLIVGPLNLNCIAKPCSAASVTATARGSGTNGPLTAQTGMTINMSKDNWWTGGKVGEVDGLGILVRQNGAHSDSSGILVNVQNQGHGFLSATEFASSIVDPVKNVLTYGIDVQEGVLDHLNGDYIGAVYTADYGALATGIQIQNSSPDASWQYAIKYLKNGGAMFSVDGAGNIVGSSASLGSVQLNGDATNGSVDVGTYEQLSHALRGSERLWDSEQCETDQRRQWSVDHRHGNRWEPASQRKRHFYGGKFSCKSCHAPEFVGAMHRWADWRGRKLYLRLHCDQSLETFRSQFLLACFGFLVSA